MKLELKHWTSYLPYNVNLKSNEGRIPSVMTGIQYPYIECTLEHNIANHFSNFSLILRPLSDLTKEIEFNGEKFVPIERLRSEFSNIYFEIGILNSLVVKGKNENFIIYSSTILINEKLCEWHFDLFSLIENNLAININNFK